MKAFAVVNPGLESYAASEIEALLKVKTDVEDSVVLFEASEEQLASLCYSAQSLIKVCSLFEKIPLKSADDLRKIKTDFTKVIKKGKTFRVKFSKQGEVSTLGQEIEPELGELIINQFKEAPKVAMNDADYIVYCYVYDDVAYIGLDYAGFDLSKREYRVFASPKSVKGNIGYILLRIAELKEKETLLDLFCLSGEVGIEAALYLTKRSPFYFSKQKFAFNKFIDFDFEKADKKIKKTTAKIVLSSPHMSEVRAAQKNAKIASVEKEIDFTRQDVEWIDFKMKKESVDKIVSIIPCPSYNFPEQALKKMYEDFFFQIKNVVKKKGKVVVLGKSLSYFKRQAKDVKLIKEIMFDNGQETLEIAVFEKI